MKRIAAAAILVASQWFVFGIHAGVPALSILGRPGADLPESRHSQPNPAPSVGTGGAVAVNEGFEQVNVFGGGIFANGWFRQNNSDDPSLYWSQNVPLTQNGRWDAFDGPTSAAVLTSYRSTQANGGTISDWIVTPLVNFGSGSAVTFQTRTASGSTFPDRLQVRVCTSGPCTKVGLSAEESGDFTTLMLDINPGETQGGFPEVWTGYTLGFAEGLPQFGSGRIAFRYYVHDSGESGTHGNVIGLDRVVVTSGEASPNALDFSVTVSQADVSDPQACGTAIALDVSVGDQVNYCYKVTNESSDALDFQYLRDDRTGALLTADAVTLAPSASLQYNRTVTMGESQSPSATWTAQGGPWGYTNVTSPVSAFVDISSDGTPIPAQQFPSVHEFPADFDFRLYGERIRHYCVLPAGLFESVRDFCASTFSFGLLAVPNDYFINAPAIAPFWALNSPLDGGSLYYKTVGTAPNRQFIVQWTDIPFTHAGTLTFQIVLHETTNVIEYRYAGDYGQVSRYASIGLQNQFLGNLYSLYSNSLVDVGSIVWAPADPIAYTATRRVDVHVGVPELALSATTVAAGAATHGTATATLEIDNPGNGRLDWSIQTGAKASNMPVVPHLVMPLGDPAKVSLGRAPATSWKNAKSPVTTRPTINVSTGNKDAYAVDLYAGPYLWQFDPNAPDQAEIAGVLNANRFITGAAFLDNDFSKLYVFDAANSQLLWYALPLGLLPEQSVHLVGTAAVPVNQANGLKQDPTSGAVYLSTADGQSSGLWTIDPNTAAVRFIGAPAASPALVDIAFDTQGNLYGVDVALDALVAIDKTTGDAQPIGSLGFDANFASGLAFDYETGLLYFSSIDVTSGSPVPGLWSIDTTTGEAMLVSPINGSDGDLAQWDALAIARPVNDACTDPASVPWLSLNPTYGTLAPNQAAMLSLAFDGSMLADGIYSASLCFYSNDPLHRHQSLPVTFTVGTAPADRIFASGFDGTSP